MACFACEVKINSINKSNVNKVKKDAFKGCRVGYYKLGLYYREVECNYKLSLDMFKKGTILGCKYSLFNIGLSYMSGIGVDINENISKFIFQKMPQIIEGDYDDDMYEAIRTDKVLQILIMSLSRFSKDKCNKNNIYEGRSHKKNKKWIFEEIVSPIIDNN